ncbi:MAG: MarR family transcriptional regulator [Methanobacteriaceae archaeon]|nr:MarR family transcriptional regulator [Methanobacteriaceae archaeon]
MDAKKDSLKENFKEVVYDSCKSLGLDDLPSRLISILQSETSEISLGKLSEMSGYSLSTLSTIIRGMEDLNMVKRFKKPKSRKVYVFMDKDIISLFKELEKKRFEQISGRAINKLSNIIDDYEDVEVYEEELELIKNYQIQIQAIAEESKKFIQALDIRRDSLKKSGKIK